MPVKMSDKIEELLNKARVPYGNLSEHHEKVSECVALPYRLEINQA
jgi:hypothetical protein